MHLGSMWCCFSRECTRVCQRIHGGTLLMVQSMKRRMEISKVRTGAGNAAQRQQSGHKSCQLMIFTLSQSHSWCTTFSKCTSHIRSKNSSETWIECESHNRLVRNIKITWIGHMRRVHAYSHDARVCTCIDAVNVQGVRRKHRAGRRKTDLIGWFWYVMCSLGYSRICNDTKRTWVWITDMMLRALASHLASE